MTLGMQVVVGSLIVSFSLLIPALQQSGWYPLGLLLGIMLVVFSLFGELPPQIAWMQRLGTWVFPGIAVGTIALLIPRLSFPTNAGSSFYAFSPLVWGAYLSIIAVGVSFEQSSMPERIYAFCRSRQLDPILLIPLYVCIAGLLGNIFDGVTIIAVSVIIFLNLLEREAAVEASFAMLFGGLISNLITVAAEPTNIKFEDVLGSMLDRVHPSYWLVNWPISVLGILVPACWLFVRFRQQRVTWRAGETEEEFAEEITGKALTTRGDVLAQMALGALVAGIIAHSTVHAVLVYHPGVTDAAPLWQFLLPAGVLAVLHLLAARRADAGVTYVRESWPVWGKLMVIFSLIWYLSNALPAHPTVFEGFFVWPEAARYGAQIVLSLLSSVTDNVALAAMQGALIRDHPLAVWQVRLLFLLLTWSGGFTSFGCLQSLALNGRLKLDTVAWFKSALPWALLSIGGGLLGLALISVLYHQ